MLTSQPEHDLGLCLTEYSLITILAVVLSGANVIGYTKCSREASQQLRDMAKRAVGAGLTVSPGACRLHEGLGKAEF